MKHLNIVAFGPTNMLGKCQFLQCPQWLVKCDHARNKNCLSSKNEAYKRKKNQLTTSFGIAWQRTKSVHRRYIYMWLSPLRLWITNLIFVTMEDKIYITFYSYCIANSKIILSLVATIIVLCIRTLNKRSHTCL